MKNVTWTGFLLIAMLAIPLPVFAKATRKVTVGATPRILIEKASGKVTGLDKSVTVTVYRKDRNRIKKKCKNIEVWIELAKRVSYSVSPNIVKVNLASFTKKVKVPMWKFAVMHFNLKVTKSKYDPQYGKYISYSALASNLTEAKSALLKLHPGNVKAKLKVRVTFEFGGAGSVGRKRYKTDNRYVYVRFERKTSGPPGRTRVPIRR